MSDAHAHLTALVVQLRAGECLAAKAVASCDFRAWNQGRRATVAQDFAAHKLITSSLPKPLSPEIEALIQEARRLAFDAVSKRRREIRAPSERARQDFCEGVADDFDLVARALAAG
jgi:hypothetical protein